MLQNTYKKHTVHKHKPPASPVLEMMNQISENPYYSPELSSNMQLRENTAPCKIQHCLVKQKY